VSIPVFALSPTTTPNFRRPVSTGSPFTGTREHDALDTSVHGSVYDGFRPFDGLVVGFLANLVGGRRARDCGEVNDNVYVLDCIGVPHVATAELVVVRRDRSEVPQARQREVIEDAHVVATSDEFGDKRVADVPRVASNEDVNPSAPRQEAVLVGGDAVFLSDEGSEDVADAFLKCLLLAADKLLKAVVLHFQLVFLVLFTGFSKCSASASRSNSSPTSAMVSASSTIATGRVVSRNYPLTTNSVAVPPEGLCFLP